MTHAVSINSYASDSRDMGFFARLLKSVSDYRSYLEVRSQLETLSDRSLDDMGVSRRDVPAVAHEAVYGL